MAKYKKQHYVPQSYLKSFACNSSRKLINIYNFEKDEIISSVNFKDQCYENYYYGKNPENEKRLGKIEGAAGATIKQILEKENIPSRSSDGHLALMLFILLQVARTPSAEFDGVSSFSNLIKELLIYGNPRLKTEIEKSRINIPHMPALNIATATRSLFLLLDLEYKIFKNKSSEGFISSEHPAVRYNSLFEAQKEHLTKTGFAIKGLQIFLPLSSKYYLVFYDTKTYKIGNKKQKIIDVDDLDNVTSMNGLQFLNSPENVYFDNTVSEAYLKKISKMFLKFRGKKKYCLKKCPQGFYLHEASRKFNLKVPKMKILKRAKEDLKQSEIRNPELLKINNMIFDEIDKKIKKPITNHST